MPLAIAPMFRPWTHTSDDNYMYQLSLVVATATVSYTCHVFLLAADLCSYLVVAAAAVLLLAAGVRHR